jgi:hypothetical protein
MHFPATDNLSKVNPAPGFLAPGSLVHHIRNSAEQQKNLQEAPRAAWWADLQADAT